MNTKTFEIEKKGLISILTNRGIWWKDFLIKDIIKNNPEKKFLIWQELDRYQDCPRIKRHCNDNMKKMLDEYSFDVLVIDYFSEWANTAENIEFIKHITTDEKYKDKTFIIFFTSNIDDREKEVNIADFQIYENVIKNNSAEIFCFNKPVYDEYKLQDKDGNMICFLKEKKDDI